MSFIEILCLSILVTFQVQADTAFIPRNSGDSFVLTNGTCNLPKSLIEEIRGYQPIVNRIIDYAINGGFAGKTWDSLSELVDTFGSRLSGSDALEKSIDYIVMKMQVEGLENVHTENASVPHWVRGDESAEMTYPYHKKLSILGLGSSIGTPKNGLEAEIIVVESFEELEKIPIYKVVGKIVVFVPKWDGYNNTGNYRGHGARVASKKGAVAVLIRSITQFSIGTPHTGMQWYGEGERQIPAASLSVEDAEMLLRKFRRGEKITINLKMDHKNLPSVISRNTIGELTGTVYKNTSVVVVSGHLDSWDIGEGAMDDGGGVMISWKALTLLKNMGLRPKRTIRSILWTGEEFGSFGAIQYYKDHLKNEKEEFNFFMESDSGTFEPRGLDFDGNPDAQCIFKEIQKLMVLLNATDFATPTDGGPDIAVYTTRGFPGASLLNKNENYFWFHHSAGDSMLVQDPTNLDKCLALWASTAYVIADLSISMPKDVE